MTLSDKRAAELLLTLLEAMRERGVKNGQIVIPIEEGRPTKIRMAEYSETVDIK